ncbi:MAG: hypothetical protein QOI91_2611 [Solirubrobacteraceae bacterium]|jgi:hypothetical protein|nr:hypothetical protein [Solirubrobacteraceae bacterium]
MKKFTIALVVVAAAALAVMPSSAAAATGGWGGWDSQHSDNLASPGYYPPAGSFGKNGPGDSRYCVDPSTALSGTNCGRSVTDPPGGGTAVYSPVVFAGVLSGSAVPTAARQGCNHDDLSDPSTNNPCNPGNTNTAGAAYVGTDETGPDGMAVGPVCYVETPEPGSEAYGTGSEGYNPYANVVPSVGCGVQG